MTPNNKTATIRNGYWYSPALGFDYFGQELDWFFGMLVGVTWVGNQLRYVNYLIENAVNRDAADFGHDVTFSQNG